MDYANSWKPDPFGVHELRFFSADGRPTPLVMDAGRRSFDRPPATDHAASPEEPPVAETPVSPSHVAPPPVLRPAVAEPHVAEPPVPDPATMDASLSESTSGFAETSTTLTTSTLPASVGTPVLAAGQVALTAADSSVGATSVMVEPVTRPDEPRTYGEAFTGDGYGVSQSIADDQQNEPLSRPLKVAYAVVLGLLTLSVVGVVLVHFTHHSDPKVSQAASVTTTTTVATTTTTVVPTALSSSAQAAATALVSSWSVNNRTVALTVATAAAVNTLFGVPYTSGQAIARGCSTSFTPIVCTYGPPGGASPSDPIYQIMVSQTNGGWYVSSVKKEN